MDTEILDRTSSSLGLALLDRCIPILWRCGTVVAGLASIVAGLLYVKQDSLLYFPEIGGIPRRTEQNPRRYRSPGEYQIPFETHMIRCDDGVSVHSWLLLQPNSQRDRNPTLVFFHGNAGNIGLRLPNAIQMYQYLKANILMVEYRGYGDSDDAKPNEAGLKLDAEAALRFISEHPQIDPSRIFLFGRSLGGAVAFHLAQYAERTGLPLAGVIVENTFLSVSLMVDHLMPLVAPLKGLVLRIGWDSGQIVPHIRTPTLFLAGSADQLVPHSHMLELYKKSAKASACARIHVIKDGTHNETWMQGGREYWDKIKSFFAEARAAERNGSFRSMSSMEDISLEDGNDGVTKRSAAIGLGTDMDQRKSAIPTMPGNLLGVVREASAAATANNVPKKKEM